MPADRAATTDAKNDWGWATVRELVDLCAFTTERVKRDKYIAELQHRIDAARDQGRREGLIEASGLLRERSNVWHNGPPQQGEISIPIRNELLRMADRILAAPVPVEESP